MRTTLSQIKGIKTGPACKQRPAVGTKRGKVWDIFFGSPGLVLKGACIANAAGVGHSSIAGTKPNELSCLVEGLNRDYDLDIRGTKKSGYCLCGRWDGVRYIDFVAARHK